MGSVSKSGEKKSPSTKHRKLLKKTRVQRRKRQVKLTGKAKQKSGRNLSFWRDRGEVNPLLQLFPTLKKAVS